MLHLIVLLTVFVAHSGLTKVGVVAAITRLYLRTVAIVGQASAGASVVVKTECFWLHYPVSATFRFVFVFCRAVLGLLYASRVAVSFDFVSRRARMFVFNQRRCLVIIAVDNSSCFQAWSWGYCDGDWISA